MEPQASHRSAEATLAWLWRPAAVWYLAVCLAGLAAGLWPRVLYNPPTHPPELPLPTLATLSVGQVAFFLLIYPLILLRRHEALSAAKDSPTAWQWWQIAVETAGLIVSTIPLYVVAAYLGDASPGRVFSAAVYVLAVAPLSWAAAWYLAWNKLARTLTMLCLLVLAMGLPTSVYLAHEFVSHALADRLWQIGPVTFAATAASAHCPSLLESPWWAWLIWPLAEMILLMLRMLLTRQTR